MPQLKRNVLQISLAVNGFKAEKRENYTHNKYDEVSQLERNLMERMKKDNHDFI